MILILTDLAHGLTYLRRFHGYQCPQRGGGMNGGHGYALFCPLCCWLLLEPYAGAEGVGVGIPGMSPVLIEEFACFYTQDADSLRACLPCWGVCQACRDRLINLMPEGIGEVLGLAGLGGNRLH
ncbi:hypothetical protein Nepgr_013498 [Nepenthes gracilis]|uniref:Uncharacterized protein n=1 Tax=Nepenthes gracilis TaxID=150966 RepID=A0AAD3SJ92_NEPGR|nr:hypothetical protein Nepgr_013498 [Nepenthes gracilis]